MVLAGVRGVDAAEIRVTFNPLVRWVWLGGALMAIGGLVVMWPQADQTARAERLRRGAQAAARAGARSGSGGRIKIAAALLLPGNER